MRNSMAPKPASWASRTAPARIQKAPSNMTSGSMDGPSNKRISRLILAGIRLLREPPHIERAICHDARFVEVSRLGLRPWLGPAYLRDERVAARPARQRCALRH